jgi:oligopeptide transport system substrate-binding protein
MRRVLGIFVLALALTACGGGGPVDGPGLTEAKGGVNYGGVFKLNEVEDFRHLYPHNVTEVVSWRIVSQVYEGLVRLDQSNLKVKPSLAEDWKVNDDATVFTFYMRKGVMFHDDPCFEGSKGREVTAKDVMYCFTKLCSMSPDNQMFWLFEGKVKGAVDYYESTKAGTPLAGGVEGVKMLDDYTIEITLESSFAGFPNLLCTPGGWIFPKEAVDMYGIDMRIKAVGSGPFKVKTVKESEVVILEKNQNYWDIDEFGNKLPYLDAIKISFKKEKKAELLAFRQGNLHMVFRLPVEMINEVIGDFEEARKGGNRPFEMQTTSSMMVQYYAFQHLDELFDDIRVRQAFNYAIDREQIVNYTLRGEGVVAEGGFVPPAFPSYPSKTVIGYTYDPDKAAALLKEAGYPGGAGFPEINLNLNSGGTINTQVAEGIQKMLKDNLGIDVVLDIKPMAQHYELLETGQAKFWRAGWSADYPDPENFLNLFHSKHVPDKLTDKAYLNPFRFKNAAFDSVFDAALAEVDDEKRMEMWAQCDQMIIDHAVVMPLYYEEIIRLMSLDIQGFDINAMELRDFTRVYFKKSEEDAAAAGQ